MSMKLGRVYIADDVHVNIKNSQIDVRRNLLNQISNKDAVITRLCSAAYVPHLHQARTASARTIHHLMMTTWQLADQLVLNQART